jgi:hypothetical protein
MPLQKFYQSDEIYPRISAIALAALVVTLTGTIAALIFVAARIGLESATLLVSLSVAVLMASAFSPFLLSEKQLMSESGIAMAALMCLGVVTSPVLSYVLPREIFIFYPLLAMFGLAKGLRYIRLKRFDIFVVTLLPPILAIYVITTFQSLQNGVNLFGLEFAKIGWFTTSAYFHATIAHLAQEFGVLTVGLDGIGIPIRYHVGSHLWFGALARIGNSTPLLSYPAGFMVVAAPLLVFSLYLLLLPRLRESRMTAGLCAVVFITLLADRLELSTQYTSESQGISLLAFGLALPLLYFLAQKRTLNVNFEVLGWILAITLLAPLTLAKISTGFLWGILLVCAALYKWGWTLRAIGVIAAAAVFSIFPLSVSVVDWGFIFDSLFGHTEKYVDPVLVSRGAFLFFRDYPVQVICVVLLGMFGVWCSFVGIRQKAARNEGSFPERQDLILLSIMLVVGVGIVGMDVGGHNSWYSLQPVRWIAVFPIAAWVTNRSFRFEKDSLSRGGMVRYFLLALALGILISVQSIKVFFNLNSTISTARTLSYAVKKDDEALYTALDRVFLRSWATNILNGNLFDKRFTIALAASPGGKLEELANAFTADGYVGKAVFVTPEQYNLWKLSFELSPFPPTFLPPLPRSCPEAFFVQAVTGLPLLMGVPPKYPGCSEGVMGSQRQNEDQVRTRAISYADLCSHAIERNITSILILRDVRQKDKNEVIKCPKL